MIKVIGFEGSWPDAAILGWGAAVVTDDARVWNSVSGLSLSAADFADSEENETYVKFGPIELRDEDAKSPMLVVALRTTAENANILRPDFGKLGGCLEKHKQKKCLYFVLKNAEVLRQYTQYVIDSVTSHALQVPLTEPERSSTFHLLTQTLALHPSHPHLHALRVLFSEDNPRVRMVAEQSLTSDIDHKTFQSMLMSFDKEREYNIKYEGGIAEGGGLNVNDGAKQLGALDNAHKKLQNVVAARYDFVDLSDLLPFRCRRLEAASATLTLSSTVAGETLLQRFARFREIELLQESIRGNIPDELQGDLKFLEALEIITNPSAGTSVYQKPIDSADSEPVSAPRFSRRTAEPKETMALFGFLEGTARSVSVAEVRLFPSLREVVSIDTDGTSHVPLGADIFQKRNDFLFRPAALVLQRFVDDRGVHKRYLKKIEMLETNSTCRINAIPSSVVDGAFLLGQDITIKFTPDGQIIANEELIHWARDDHSIRKACEWMARYAAWCASLEFAAAASHEAQWLRVPKQRQPNAITRILMCLDTMGERAELDALVVEVNRRHNLSLRKNNTRREVREHPDLVAYDVEEQEIVQLTNRGRLFVSIVKRAGAEHFYSSL